jgi:hypothetical protein
MEGNERTCLASLLARKVEIRGNKTNHAVTARCVRQDKQGRERGISLLLARRILKARTPKQNEAQQCKCTCRWASVYIRRWAWSALTSSLADVSDACHTVLGCALQCAARAARAARGHVAIC